MAQTWCINKETRESTNFKALMRTEQLGSHFSSFLIHVGLFLLIYAPNLSRLNLKERDDKLIWSKNF